MNFLTDLDPTYPEAGLRWLFNNFFIQAYKQFRPVAALTHERLQAAESCGQRVRRGWRSA
jgi:hypothetical protein